MAKYINPYLCYPAGLNSEPKLNHACSTYENFLAHRLTSAFGHPSRCITVMASLETPAGHTATTKSTILLPIDSPWRQMNINPKGAQGPRLALCLFS
eukprot:scaffold286_cov169-Amphora_coffeaeformis.AAC.25